jgi:hypothetical protein
VICGKDLEREQKWADDKKYYAARSAWKRRHQLVEGKGYTWGQWFQRMFGEKLTDYAARKAKKNQRLFSSSLASFPVSRLNFIAR